MEIRLGPSHLRRLDSIVDPLILPDLTTVVWAPHGHDEAIDALRGLADVVLLDSMDQPDMRAAVKPRQRGWPTTSTWLTWPGCAARPGASGSPPPSTPTSGARRCGRSPAW